MDFSGGIRGDEVDKILYDSGDLTCSRVCARLNIGCREPRLDVGSLFVL